MSDLNLNTDPELVSLTADNITAFLVKERVLHESDRWFTVPEIAKALNLGRALSIAYLAFKEVRDRGIVEMQDGAIRWKETRRRP